MADINRRKRSLSSFCPARAASSAAEYSSDEVMYVKMKNHDLAKKIAEMQAQNAQLVSERRELNEALFNERCRNNAIEQKFCDVKKQCDMALEQMVALSNTLTTIMMRLSDNNNHAPPRDATPKDNASVRQKQRTKAVKPMVSGCTISKPTIKLNRISEQLLQATRNGRAIERREAEREMEPVRTSEREVEPVRTSLPGIDLEELQENLEDQEEEETPDSLQEQEVPGNALSVISERTEQDSSRAYVNQIDDSLSRRCVYCLL